MTIRVLSPTPADIQTYQYSGFYLQATDEEKKVRDEASQNKTSLKHLAPIAQTYFEAAQNETKPEFQAIFFCKARRLAQEAGITYPSLDPLIAESGLKEALACESVANKTLNHQEKLAWYLLGAQAITPNAANIKESILDPLYTSERYQVGSRLWEKAAQLVVRNKGGFELSASYYENAAQCSKRAYVLNKSEEEKKRLIYLLKGAKANYQMIELQEGSTATLQSKIVRVLEWQSNLLAKDQSKASEKYLQVAQMFEKEAQERPEMAPEWLLQQAIHTEKAASLALPNQKVELMEKALQIAQLFEKMYPEHTSHPLFNTEWPYSYYMTQQLPWVYGVKLEGYRTLEPHASTP